MKNYNKNFEFDLKDNINLKNKIKQYLDVYNFEQKKDSNNHLVFIKEGGLLNGWKFNPLNWESEINIKLYENKRAIIQHTVLANGFLTPIAFTTLFKSFLINLEQFVNHNINFQENNSWQIKLAKRRVFKYHGLVIIGILLGLVCGIIFTKLSGMELFSTIGIIFGASLTTKLINQYLIKDNNLQNRV